MSTFKELGVSDALTDAIEKLGYQTPTEIQRLAIPVILGGGDVVGQAQTGTGKTAAFALPLIQRLSAQSAVQALILTPTRELAHQVSQSLVSYGARRADACLIYGGQPIAPQIRALERGPRIVIGTPGRVIDHLKRGTLKLESLTTAVLDEADEMLKMGFRDEVEWILSQAPSERQTLLFSATMPREIEEIATHHLRSDSVRLTVRGEGRGSDDVEQSYLLVRRDDKFSALKGLLELESEGITIVFVRTRRESTQMVDRLQARGVSAEALNGELNQDLRDAVVRRLKTGRASAVIATDVAARGLDIDGVSLVVNYDIPQDLETYVHRIGRTGRAGRVGRAVLLVTPREVRALQRLERYLKRSLKPISAPRPEEILESRAHRLKSRLNRALDELSRASDDEITRYRTLISELIDQSEPDLDELGLDGSEDQGESSERELDDEMGSETASDAGSESSRVSRESRFEQLALAALKLASQHASLSPESAPRALPHLDIERLKSHRAPQITAREGCSIIVMYSGRNRGVRPKDIVGAIAHGARVDGSLVGAIRIEEQRTLFELPDEQVVTVIERLTGRRVCGEPARFEVWDGSPEPQVTRAPNQTRRGAG